MPYKNSKPFIDLGEIVERNKCLEAENKRLREALAFYAKEENHLRYDYDPNIIRDSLIDNDFGQIAREALL